MRSRLVFISTPYREVKTARSLAQLGVTVFLLIVSYVAGMAVIQRSMLAGMFFAMASSAFVVRLFIIQHDCGHRSFFRSRQANDLLGFFLGIVTMTPHVCWRRFHGLHHSNSGNLDHRGIGDIYTLTTKEYESLPLTRQWLYRFYRHPLILLVLGPPFLFILRQRTTFKVPREWKSERHSIHATNLGILGFGAALCGIYDPYLVIIYHAAIMSLSAIAGVWLFYVQHQYPDTYWAQKPEWESWRASMEGASYYELPAILRWLTANIGLHHIHHLDARIPNYRLYECFLNHPEFASPRRISLRESLRCMSLRLWDTQAQRMVPFPSSPGHRRVENAT